MRGAGEAGDTHKCMSPDTCAPPRICPKLRVQQGPPERGPSREDEMKRAPVAGLVLAVALMGGTAAHAQKVIAKDGHELPDWSGVWQMIGNTVFDQATKSPANGVAGLPGTKEAVPYNAEWQKKYEANMAR